MVFEPPPEDKTSTRMDLMRGLRNNFLTGVVVVMPIAVTLWLVLAVVGFVDRVVKPIIPPIYNPETYLPFAVPGLGLVFAVMFLTALGAFAANYAGRAALAWADRLVERVPLIRNIYKAVKQLITTFMLQREQSFREVVLVQYPRDGTWVLGFVTRAAVGEVAAALGPGFVGVFVPTTPNPTSGFLIYEHRDRMKTLKMSVEDGAKMIVSAGLVAPGEEMPDPSPVPPPPPEAREGDY